MYYVLHTLFTILFADDFGSLFFFSVGIPRRAQEQDRVF